ncbi:MAG: DUF3194 domain-containing protein [Candidatus Thorarchaeota archaeon]|nr:DUF3194 domain-containing protein [Candidatus Thorarchaeota archaeon]
MNETENIGLPSLSEEDIERLTDACEAEVRSFIVQRIPQKSISELVILCSMDLDEELKVEVETVIVQDYDTGVSLKELADEASVHGIEWLRSHLLEMKG